MAKARTAFVFSALLALWLPLVHRCLEPSARDAAEAPVKLAARQLDQIERLAFDARDMAVMRRANPEWDLLGRGMLAMSLADMALADASRTPRHLAAIDQLIREAVEGEQAHGHPYFLLPYGRGVERSLFVDSQLAMMMGARLAVAPDRALRAQLEDRARRLEAALGEAPARFAESYPDEGWTYDHTTALAALRVWDSLSGEDHRGLCARWVEAARARLVDPKTGLLVSSFHRDGAWRDRGEGSSLWMSAHNLLLVDEGFAREQYGRGVALLRREVLGFTVAREWPEGEGQQDVDSGPVIPVLGASPGSSGLMLIAAAAFEDHPTLDGLVASLKLAAFPIEQDGKLTFAAAGQVGDGAILRALTFGPLWRRVRGLNPPLSLAQP